MFNNNCNMNIDRDIREMSREEMLYQITHDVDMAYYCSDNLLQCILQACRNAKKERREMERLEVISFLHDLKEKHEAEKREAVHGYLCYELHTEEHEASRNADHAE